MNNEQQRISLLETMVEIQSHSREEQKIAEFLVSYMNQNGFMASIDAAGNAVGMKGDPEAETEIMLLGHMDTVPGDVPFRRQGDILWGRGSVDAKGPLAAFVTAVSEIDPPENCRFVVIGAVEEEISTSRGARHVVDQYQPDFCIIGEPSGSDGVTIAYKGRLLIKAELKIPCSHTASAATSAAERGVLFWNNIISFRERFNSDKNTLFASLLTDLRVMQTATDNLHDSVTLSGGFRLPPDFDLEDFQRDICNFDPDFKVQFSGHEQAWSGDSRSSLVRHFTRAIRETGKRPRIKYKTGTSDMNVVGPVWKCPILAYGPGDSALDHTPDEHIYISEYLESIEILKRSLIFLSNG